MLEIEGKYPVQNWEGLERRLGQLGAHLEEEREEADHYFNAPDRDFAQTDEAFRIRRVGDHNLVTYKGPRAAGPTKTRLEIEIPFANGDVPAADLSRLLQQLGYRPVAVVRKKRRIFLMLFDEFDVHVSLDDVEHVGCFAEVEVVTKESNADDAKEVVLHVANELGLSAPERRSYLQLLLERKS